MIGSRRFLAAGSCSRCCCGLLPDSLNCQYLCLHLFLIQLEWHVFKMQLFWTNEHFWVVTFSVSYRSSYQFNHSPADFLTCYHFEIYQVAFAEC